MVKENPTFDISNLTLQEKQIREKDINVFYETMKKTKVELSKPDCEGIYDKMQQAAIEAGHSRWTFYQTTQLN
ncbi:hypothetical protein BH11BAC7_BH11BAC7_26540 [soil metagenome]